MELQESLSPLLSQDPDFCIVLYGSAADDQSYFLSDIDLMCFIADKYFNPELVAKVNDKFVTLLEAHQIRLDDEIPRERKLLIPISFANRVASKRGFLQIASPPLVKIDQSGKRCLNFTDPFSDEILARLVFNVLTVPHRLIAGSGDALSTLIPLAEQSLVELMIEMDENISSSEEFAQKSIGKAPVCGEMFLGYKDDPLVKNHLMKVWTRHCPSAFQSKV